MCWCTGVTGSNSRHGRGNAAPAAKRRLRAAYFRPSRTGNFLNNIHGAASIIQPSTRCVTDMKNLHVIFRRLLWSAMAITAMSLASCTTYPPGGYYGANGPTTGTAPYEGDGKGTYSTGEYTPPPTNYV